MFVHLTNGRVLTPDGPPFRADLTVSASSGEIVAVGGACPPEAVSYDVDGALVLPGIVDLHGDAFERQLMPRPGVDIAPPVALIETDRQLLANGVTTAFHAMTWSWEPGLRSTAAGIAFIGALEAMRPRLDCDTRLHLRHETYNLAGETALVGMIEAGAIDLLAINDHTPVMAEKAKVHPQELAGAADRSGLPLDDFLAVLARVAAEADAVPDSVARICAAARGRGIAMASHDDSSPDVRAHYRALGCGICEFPVDVDTARAARATGASMVLGAPNVLRGGSHTGFVGAADMVGHGLCDVLVSDYYYPALPVAPFRLVADGVCDFATAWRLVSTNPATAAGLDDRGEIVPGRRADIAVIDDSDPAVPRILSTFVAGRPVFHAAGFGSLIPSRAAALRTGERS